MDHRKSLGQWTPREEEPRSWQELLDSKNRTFLLVHYEKFLCTVYSILI